MGSQDSLEVMASIMIAFQVSILFNYLKLKVILLLWGGAPRFYYYPELGARLVVLELVGSEAGGKVLEVEGAGY